MVARLTEKVHLSAQGLLQRVRKGFAKVREPTKGTQGQSSAISVGDCLMSALAMFKLKFPSLLQFDKERVEEPVASNLKSLFGVGGVPCDTYMRERLDEWVQPLFIRTAGRLFQSARSPS